MPRKSFYTILTEAVSDITDHGFDSQKRINEWMELLRDSAEAALTSKRTMDKMLRDGLTSIYRRLIDQGQIIQRHPGVNLRTIKDIKPALRAELDRRIMASADLITLNREVAVNKTLARFSGWSTSIPKGGVENSKKTKTKKEIRKALASLPFEERRVLIDQGQKLAASLSEIVANDGGAIAGIWHSRWRQQNYDYREQHKERDGEIYLVRDSWAAKAGLVKGKYYDQVEGVAELPFCRCYMTWLHGLGSLPKSSLTTKGVERLKEAREKATA